MESSHFGENNRNAKSLSFQKHLLQPGHLPPWKTLLSPRAPSGWKPLRGTGSCREQSGRQHSRGRGRRCPGWRAWLLPGPQVSKSSVQSPQALEACFWNRTVCCIGTTLEQWLINVCKSLCPWKAFHEFSNFYGDCFFPEVHWLLAKGLGKSRC